MAYKISIWIALFLLFLNGGHVVLGASGTYDYLDVSPTIGDTSELDDAGAAPEDFETGDGSGDTLFGLYSSIGNVWNAVINGVFPAASIMKNLGMPDYIVNFTFSGLTTVMGLDVAKLIRSG